MKLQIYNVSLFFFSETKVYINSVLSSFTSICRYLFQISASIHVCSEEKRHWTDEKEKELKTSFLINEKKRIHNLIVNTFRRRQRLQEMQLDYSSYLVQLYNRIFPGYSTTEAQQYSNTYQCFLRDRMYTPH